MTLSPKSQHILNEAKKFEQRALPYRFQYVLNESKNNIHIDFLIITSFSNGSIKSYVLSV